MRTTKTSTLALTLPVGLLFLGSCVTQQRYDEALQEARYYQRMYQDITPMTGELEAEIERLRGELDLYQQSGQTIESAATREIDERLADLENIAAGLGTGAGEVTVLQVQGGYGFRLSNAVLFNSGSADLTDEGKAVLAGLARDISARPFERIWVRGHTDSDPIVRESTRRLFPTNLHLSASRALGVAVDLIAAGLPPGKVVVAGFGPNEPMASNTSSDGKAQNRRVEIFVIEDEEAAATPARGSGDK